MRAETWLGAGLHGCSVLGQVVAKNYTRSSNALKPKKWTPTHCQGVLLVL